MAPEGAHGGRAMEAPADVFAFGILAYELLSGGYPFAMLPAVAEMAHLPAQDAIDLNDSRVDVRVRDLVMSCLSFESKLRPRARNMLDVLRTVEGTTLFKND